MGNESEPESNRSDVFTYNAAGAQLLASTWMVHFLFTDAQPSHGKVVEVPRINIGIPWPLAKVLLKVLTAAIERYEAQVGPITVPKAVETALEEQIAAAQKQNG